MRLTCCSESATVQADHMVCCFTDNQEWTHCRSSCRRPAAAVPLGRYSSKILGCSHTGAHSHAPQCYTGPCLQAHRLQTHNIKQHLSRHTQTQRTLKTTGLLHYHRFILKSFVYLDSTSEHMAAAGFKKCFVFFLYLNPAI